MKPYWEDLEDKVTELEEENRKLRRHILLIKEATDNISDLCLVLMKND